MTIRPLPTLFAALLCAAAPMASVDAQTPGNAAAIAYEKKVINLGKVELGAKVRGTVAVTNSGKQPLMITRIDSGDKRYVALDDKLEEALVVWPGQTQEIGYLFRSPKEPGRISVSLSIISNAANEPNATLRIDANVGTWPKKAGG